MASRKTFIRSQGFTFIEILIVLGLIMLVAGLGLFLSMDVYRSNSLHAEKNIVVSILQKARSRAMNNINENKHGVHFGAGKYILFTGPDWTLDPHPEDVSATTNVTATGTTDVVFDQLTGNASCSPAPPCAIALKNDLQTFVISINSAGQISWH